MRALKYSQLTLKIQAIKEELCELRSMEMTGSSKIIMAKIGAGVTPISQIPAIPGSGAQVQSPVAFKMIYGLVEKSPIRILNLIVC